MDDLLRQIGNRILSRRKQLLMTQEELANKAGITGLQFQTDKKVHDPESGHNGVCFQCNKFCHHRSNRRWKDLQRN